MWLWIKPRILREVWKEREETDFMEGRINWDLEAESEVTEKDENLH